MGFARQEYWSGVPFPSPSLPISKYKWIWGLSVIAEALSHLFGVQVQIWNDNDPHIRNWLIGELYRGLLLIYCKFQFIYHNLIEFALEPFN